MRLTRFIPDLFPTAHLRILALFAALMAFAGCAAGGGGVSMVATISGGEKVAVPIGRGGVEPTRRDGVQTEPVIFTLSPDKKLVYLFGFTDAKNRALKNVRVEDVSEAAPVTLFEDDAPALEKGRWHKTSAPFGPGQPHLAWMATITNTVRVFRFTLTFADGQQLALLQGAMFPAFVKEGVRKEWGEKY